MSKQLPWFKVYTEARTDKKLAHLTLAERGVWINLLMYAAEQDARGSFDANDRDILAMECAEGDVKTLDRTIKKLQQSKHLICCMEHTGYLTFRTFAERQARKPSDEKLAQNERQRRSRASRKSHALSRVTVTENANVTRLEEEVEKEREVRYDPTFSSSGEVSNKAAVVAPAAPAAASANGHNHWTEERAKRTADEVARKIRLPFAEVPDLIDFIRACPALSHERIIAETASYRGWLTRERTSAKPSVFYNKWLMPANAKAEQERLQQHALLHGKGSPDGQQQQSQPAARPASTEPDTLYTYHQKRAAEAEAARAKMVS